MLFCIYVLWQASDKDLGSDPQRLVRAVAERYHGFAWLSSCMAAIAGPPRAALPLPCAVLLGMLHRLEETV